MVEILTWCGNIVASDHGIVIAIVTHTVGLVHQLMHEPKPSCSAIQKVCRDLFVDIIRNIVCLYIGTGSVLEEERQAIRICK